MKKEERLQEKDSVIKILKQGQDGNSVTLAKKIHKQKARLKLQVKHSFLLISFLTCQVR